MSEDCYNGYYGSGDPSPTQDSIGESQYSPSCFGLLNQKDISEPWDPSSCQESGTGDDASMPLEDEDVSHLNLFQAESGSGRAEAFEQQAPLLGVAMPGVDDNSLAMRFELNPTNDNPSPYPAHLPDHDLMDGTLRSFSPPNAEPPPCPVSYQRGTENRNRDDRSMPEYQSGNLQVHTVGALHIDQRGKRREDERAYQRPQLSAISSRGYVCEQYGPQSDPDFVQSLETQPIRGLEPSRSSLYRDLSTWTTSSAQQHTANFERVAARGSVQSSHDEPWSQMNTRVRLAHTDVEQPPHAYIARAPSQDWSNNSSDQTRFTPGSSWQSDPNGPMTTSTATLRPQPALGDYWDQEDNRRSYRIVIQSPGIGGSITAYDLAQEQGMNLDPSDQTTNSQPNVDSFPTGLQPLFQSNNRGGLQIPPQGHGSEASSPTPSTMSVTSSSYPDPVVCVECGKEYSGDYRKGNLARHRRQKHNGTEKLYVCEEPGCSSGPFKRQDARLKHYRRRHPWRATTAPIPRKY